MDDFKHAHGYLKSFENTEKAIISGLNKLKSKMNSTDDTENIKICSDGIARLNRAKTFVSAWVNQLRKTIFIITKVSEIARGGQE